MEKVNETNPVPNFSRRPDYLHLYTATQEEIVMPFSSPRLVIHNPDDATEATAKSEDTAAQGVLRPHASEDTRALPPDYRLCESREAVADLRLA
jgi:hypothetical protein